MVDVLGRPLKNGDMIVYAHCKYGLITGMTEIFDGLFVGSCANDYTVSLITNYDEAEIAKYNELCSAYTLYCRTRSSKLEVGSLLSCGKFAKILYLGQGELTYELDYKRELHTKKKTGHIFIKIGHSEKSPCIFENTDIVSVKDLGSVRVYCYKKTESMLKDCIMEDRIVTLKELQNTSGTLILHTICTVDSITNSGIAKIKLN